MPSNNLERDLKRKMEAGFRKANAEANRLFAAEPDLVGLEARLKRIYAKHGIPLTSQQIRKVIEDYKQHNS